ncbi:MAG: phosphomannomutase, partial [Gammaproteobacteria bacterium]
MEESGVGFGTSGARGLASDMTDLICYAYARAFLQYLFSLGELKPDDNVALAGDLRESTPRIMAAVGRAIADSGCRILNCGHIPTPALACCSMKRGIPGIMVTGSHIPKNRNGIKFYRPGGEILKADEQAIRAISVDIPAFAFDAADMLVEPFSLPRVVGEAREEYIARYVDFFGEEFLQGLRIGIYQHSSVARDILSEALERLGAETVILGRSDRFIPVDTEAIRS